MGGISVPLSVYGAYKGNMAPKIKVATKVNLIPRQIPETKDKLSHRLRLICAGLVPFFAAFIEIYILMNSIWLDRFYFMVGGFILIFFILSAVSCEMTIILCYLQLCQEYSVVQNDSIVTRLQPYKKLVGINGK